MRESRRTLKRVVEDAARQAEPALLQRNPFFPDLLNQPDVVIVPELGRLVAIYLYAPTQAVSWRTVLTAIEDLFELKTSVQQSAVAIALQDFRHGISQTSTNAVPFLEQMFDLLIPVHQELAVDALSRELRRAIRQVPAKEHHFHVWAAEKERMSNELRRFSEDRYRRLLEPQPLARSRSGTELVARIADEVNKMGLEPRRNALIRTPKEAMGGLPERSRFSFDLMFRDRAGRQVVIDALSVRRSGPRPFVRYLMTKARFTSYEPAQYETGQPFRLVPRYEPLRRVLLVDGSLAGPEHDPYRYVRALVSVGWDIERAEEEILPRLADANV